MMPPGDIPCTDCGLLETDMRCHGLEATHGGHLEKATH